MSRTVGRVFAAGCAAAALGCSSSSSNAGGTSDAFISASVNGVTFTATTGLQAHYGFNALVFSGFDANQTQEILFTVTGVTGTGTYPLGGTSVAEYTTGGLPQWSSGSSGGSGTITINSLTATGAQGTFSFVGGAVGGTGATGSKTVSSGTFNVTF
jgi:hypothetical protein